MTNDFINQKISDDKQHLHRHEGKLTDGECIIRTISVSFCILPPLRHCTQVHDR